MSQSLLRSSLLVSAWTLVSRVLGFVRDVLLAGWFGAGAGMDAFLVAFKIPNFLRRLFAEGAFSQAFVPVLAQTREAEGEQGVRELVARTLGLLATVLALLTLAAIAGSPWLIRLFAPGFTVEDGRATLAAGLLQITFPYLFFISLVALASAVLQTWKRFAWPAFAPVLLNLCLIGFGWWGTTHAAQPLYALSWGVFAAGAAQLLLVALPLWRMGLLGWPQWRWRDSRVRRILRLMAPIVFASSVAQLALLVDSILASLLLVGSVSWLYFADRLMELPLGVFAIAIGTVLLPALSAAHARREAAAFAAQLHWSITVAALIILPAAAALFVLALPLVATLFQYGEFGAVDSTMTARALRAYAFGLIGFSYVKILFPAYSSRQDTRTPVRIAVMALLIGTGFNLVAITLVLARDLPGMHWLLALGTSLGALLNATWLWRRLPAELRAGQAAGQGGGTLPRVAAAALLMGAGLWLLAPAAPWWLAAGMGARVLALAGLIAAGLAGYLLALLLLGVRPWALLRPAAA